ncbi:MAG: UDP-N-acetylglucosamine--LPS N-acetylglucosamine transferase [Cytophagales bacterium]|nr:UDP-N-acetylglucosamine--LPS N-acetylglucosamine transferase [Rhizobacter sp.]
MTRTASPLLLLHATAGAGHTRAAQAVAAALGQQSSPAHQVVDTLECTSTFFRRMYVKAYIELVQRAPELWGALYERYDVVKPPTSKSARARLVFDKTNSRAFKDLLKATQPKAILCTHFLPMELLSDLKGRGKLHTPVHAVVTDVSPHAFWVYPHIDHYHVASEVGARELARKGIAPDRISVSGIPIDPVFAQRTPAPAMRAQLGLPERPTVLLLSGGFGVGPLVAMLDSFAGADCGLSLVVVAGRNAELEAACRARAAELNMPVTVHGFVTNIHELMDAAHLVVTKPGGLTTNEILAKGKPMALVAPIPGQEQRNCDYLLEEGAAVRLHDVSDAAWHLQRWLGNTALMAAMRRSAERIARPQAAADVAQRLCQAVA